MRRLRFGSVHFGKKREKRLGDGNARGTEILDARFTYAADALDSGVAFPEERLDRFGGFFFFSDGSGFSGSGAGGSRLKTASGWSAR